MPASKRTIVEPIRSYGHGVESSKASEFSTHKTQTHKQTDLQRRASLQ